MDPYDVERDLRAFVAKHLPALPETRCVLAASGGADSTAMVALLIECGIVSRDRTVVGHFDHRLRGDAASQRDRTAVEALCERYGLELEVEAWDAPRRGEGAARDARYAALARIASRTDATAIVTGHTSDDQAETIVMHTMRGAGLHGLAGMALDAPHPSNLALTIMRPLLSTTRAQTRAYCGALRLMFEDDETNAGGAMLRNRVRHDILPAMERSAPGVRAAFSDVAAVARVASQALDAAAAEFVPQRDDGDHVVVTRSALRSAPPELVPHAFRLAVARLLGDARDFERRHYRLMAGAAAGATGATLMLPRGVVLTVDADAVRLSRGPLVSAPLGAAFARELPFEGDAGAWSLRIFPAAEGRLADGGLDLRLPDGAVVRARQPGDRVRTRAGGKKLGDWYTDRKVPRRDRDAAPVVAYGQQVFWTPLAPLGELPHGRAWRIICHRARRERGFGS